MTTADTSQLYQSCADWTDSSGRGLAQLQDPSVQEMDTDDKLGGAQCLGLEAAREPSIGIGACLWPGVNGEKEKQEQEGEAWTEHTRETEQNSSVSRTGLTQSLLPDETPEVSGGSSQTDTGYATRGTLHSLNSFSSSLLPEASLAQDSGSHSYKQGISGASVSALGPPGSSVSALGPPAAVPGPAPLISYACAVENCNDISVGFPLGSSTPTKK